MAWIRILLSLNSLYVVRKVVLIWSFKSSRDIDLFSRFLYFRPNLFTKGDEGLVHTS